MEKNLAALASEGISGTISGTLHYRDLVLPGHFGYTPGQAEVRGPDVGVRAQTSSMQGTQQASPVRERGYWPKGLRQAQSLALCTNLNPLPDSLCEE